MFKTKPRDKENIISKNLETKQANITLFKRDKKHTYIFCIYSLNTHIYYSVYTEWIGNERTAMRPTLRWLHYK